MVQAPLGSFVLAWAQDRGLLSPLPMLLHLHWPLLPWIEGRGAEKRMKRGKTEMKEGEGHEGGLADFQDAVIGFGT